MTDFPRQSANVGIEITIWPAANPLSSRQRWAAMDEAVDGATQLLEERIEMLLALLAAGDGADVDLLSAWLALKPTKKQVTSVEVLCFGLDQQECAVRFQEALEQQRCGDIAPRMEYDMLEMSRAVADE